MAGQGESIVQLSDRDTPADLSWLHARRSRVTPEGEFEAGDRWHLCDAVAQPPRPASSLGLGHSSPTDDCDGVVRLSGRAAPGWLSINQPRAMRQTQTPATPEPGTTTRQPPRSPSASPPSTPCRAARQQQHPRLSSMRYGPEPVSILAMDRGTSSSPELELRLPTVQSTKVKRKARSHHATVFSKSVDWELQGAAGEEDRGVRRSRLAAPLRRSPSETVMVLSKDDVADLRETGLRQQSPDRPRAITPTRDSPQAHLSSAIDEIPPTTQPRPAVRSKKGSFSMCCGSRPARDPPPNETSGKPKLAVTPPRSLSVSVPVSGRGSPAHPGYDLWHEGTNGESPASAVIAGAAKLKSLHNGRSARQFERGHSQLSMVAFADRPVRMVACADRLASRRKHVSFKTGEADLLAEFRVAL